MLALIAQFLSQGFDMGIYCPSTMGAHVSACPNHQTGRSVPLSTRATVAMAGTFGYELDPAKLTLFCVAVNLLELQEINEILLQIKGNSELERLTLKEKSSYAAGVFQNAAKRKNIELKLRKKK